jgi:hypothetical protein
MSKHLKTFKQIIWAPVKPIYPFFRNLAIKLRLVKVPDGRQHFHIGYLKSDVDHKKLALHLEKYDFKHQWMAFIDPDEVLGMRKLHDHDYRFQYHVRVFADGEIRGHYEKTPEDFPFDHLNEIGFEDRYEDFVQFLGEHVTPTKR